MAVLRLILLAYFVARCLGSSMGVLPTSALDVAFAQEPSSARQLRNSHLEQGASDAGTDDAEVAALQLDDDFVAPSDDGVPGIVPSVRTDGTAPLKHLPVFAEGPFRPPQTRA